MNVGPMSGVVSSAAGAPLSQTKGSETERSQKDSAAQKRQADSQEKAEKTAGIGQTEHDEGASDRDADGRQFWEQPKENTEHQEQPPPKPPRQAKDPKGESGSSLDLTG